MRLARLVPLAVASIAALASPPAWADTGTTVASGWWNETSVGPLTGPSSTSSDQLHVSNGLSGPLAFAALRISVPAGTPANSDVTVRLAVPSGSTVGTAAVSACPTSGSWKPGADQQASTAPKYSCQWGRQADGHLSVGAETWSFPLSWGTDGTVSVALVPTPGSSQPFSATYTSPTAAAISLGPAPSGPPAPSPSAGQPAPAGGDGSSAGTAVAGGGTQTGGAATPLPGAGSVSSGAAAAPSLGAIPASGGTGTASPVSSPSAAGGVGSRPAGAPVAAAPTGEHPASGPTGGRVMAFCLLVATGLALFFLAAQPDRAPKLLGPLSARVRGPAKAPDGRAGTPSPAVIGGLGRFARERTAPPTRL